VTLAEQPLLETAAGIRSCLDSKVASARDTGLVLKGGPLVWQGRPGSQDTAWGLLRAWALIYCSDWLPVFFLIPTGHDALL
jgi:hypothetical protein